MMGLPNCREITRIVLEGEDRSLRRTEQMVVRAHYLICRNCTSFGKQVALLRKASARWRSYSED